MSHCRVEQVPMTDEMRKMLTVKRDVCIPGATHCRSADTEGTGQISPESAPAPESDLDLLLLLQAAQALEIYAHAVESGMVDDDLHSAYAHASPIAAALRQRMGREG